MRRENRRRRPRARRLLSRNTPADSTGSPRCGKSLRSPHRQVYIVVRLFGVPFIRKSTALCPECPDVSHVGSTYFWRCACGTTLVPCRRWSCGRARRRVWRRFHFDALRMLVSDAEVASSIAPSLNRILQCALNTDEDDVAVPASSSDVHLCRLGVCPPPKKKNISPTSSLSHIGFHFRVSLLRFRQLYTLSTIYSSRHLAFPIQLQPNTLAINFALHSSSCLRHLCRCMKAWALS